ncbi:MAG: DNA primase [Chloroflexi bacterium]|nr:DNA primase [Chloroflexota bacterium]
MATTVNSQNPIEEIKSRTDIVETISRFVNLKRAGRNFKGLCPFHGEKTPSFIVFPDSASYHCFGCGRNGDIFHFLMDIEGKDFREVLSDLARATGVVLHTSPEKKTAREEEQRLLELNQTAAYYFHQILNQSAGAAQARDYIEARGINRKTIQEFLIGFAPESWDSLWNHLAGRGFSMKDALAVGLVVEREGGGVYDRFRGRVMFPIKDAEGRVRGFGGRSIDGSQPKYLNSPDSLVFSKGSLFYAMDAAREHIRSTGAAVVVEGYTDALMAHQAGYGNVIASMGTAIGDHHISILKKLTGNFILALDADKAGDMATLRGLEVIRSNVEHLRVPIRTREGSTGFELRPSVTIRVVSMPRGKDPCDIIREDPQSWARLVESASPVADHAIALVSVRHDLNTAEGKSAFVREATPVISQLADPVEKAHYVQKIARLTHLDESAIRASIAKSARHGTTRVASEEEGRRPGKDLEQHLLLILMRYPGLLAEVDVEKLADLLGVEYNLALEALVQSASTGSLELEHFFSALGPNLEGFGRELASLTASEPELPDAQLEAVLDNLLRRIERRRLSEKLRQYQFMVREADESGDQEWASRLKAEIAQLASQMSRFDPRPSPLFRDSRCTD